MRSVDEREKVCELVEEENCTAGFKRCIIGLNFFFELAVVVNYTCSVAGIVLGLRRQYCTPLPLLDTVSLLSDTPEQLLMLTYGTPRRVTAV